jgi:dihydrodipicolinate synthase/N-acetylneuraminate lyase
MIWKGVMPAITTPFTEQLQVDHPSLSSHSIWLLENGCPGIARRGCDSCFRRENAGSPYLREGG